MTTPTNPDDLDVGHDFTITKTTRRQGNAGVWVQGSLNEHRFEALLFPEHAEDAAYELGDSRISKLWILRRADDRTVFNFDRGMDLPPIDEVAQQIAGFLEAGLAEHVFGG